jgi:hypothetical protein
MAHSAFTLRAKTPSGSPFAVPPMERIQFEERHSDISAQLIVFRRRHAVSLKSHRERSETLVNEKPQATRKTLARAIEKILKKYQHKKK